jgi:hypothetical protein
MPGIFAVPAGASEMEDDATHTEVSELSLHGDLSRISADKSFVVLVGLSTGSAYCPNNRH